jgi:serine/threonine protein kinase
MKDGNLRDFLRQARPTSEQPEMQVRPAQLMAFMVDIARGMEFLSQRNCIHRDLAARNVLLDLPRAAIADFGLARYMDAEYAYLVKNKQRKLPTKWLAPEALMDQAFTTHTDVW